MKFLSFALVLVIALAGLLSPQPPPPLFPYIGFVLHCCGFILIALTARMAFPQVRTLWFWSILFASAFLAEFIQLLQPLRGFSWHDIHANLLGVLLAAIMRQLFFSLQRLWRRRSSTQR